MLNCKSKSIDSNRYCFGNNDFVKMMRVPFVDSKIKSAEKSHLIGIPFVIKNRRFISIAIAVFHF